MKPLRTVQAHWIGFVPAMAKAITRTQEGLAFKKPSGRSSIHLPSGGPAHVEICQEHYWCKRTDHPKTRYKSTNKPTVSQEQVEEMQREEMNTATFSFAKLGEPATASQRCHEHHEDLQVAAGWAPSLWLEQQLEPKTCDISQHVTTCRNWPHLF